MHLRTAAQSLAILGALMGTSLADEYANFFDDQYCAVNGGIGVSMTNDGCLNEQGRGSVYIPNYSGSSIGLCTYGQADCQGGSFGDPWYFTATGFCEALQTPGAVSYRFVTNYKC